MAEHCFAGEEEKLIVQNNESLEGKRVVISIDGGRTRTRTYTGEVNELEHSKFDTNWREPKLFVIDILNELGQPDKNALPIYGCRFGEQDVFELLSRYLKNLEVSKVKSIQILGDGAPWIWNHTKKVLLKLGVAEKYAPTRHHLVLSLKCIYFCIKNNSMTKESRQYHVTSWSSSGKSKMDYCKEHNLKYTSFQYWVRKIRDANKNQSKAKGKFIELPRRDMVVKKEMELVLPNGIRILQSHISDLELIRLLYAI